MGTNPTTTPAATDMPRVVQIAKYGLIHLVVDGRTACGRIIPDAADFGNADEFNHDESSCRRCYPALVDAFEAMLAARDAEAALAEAAADAQDDMDAPRLIDAEGIKPSLATGPGVSTVELLFDPATEKWQFRVVRTFERQTTTVTTNTGTDGHMARVGFEALAGRAPAGIEWAIEAVKCPDCQTARVWSDKFGVYACACGEEAFLAPRDITTEPGESIYTDSEDRMLLHLPVTLTHPVESYRLA